MLCKKEILELEELYDDQKYPFSIYEELVINQIHHSNKLELMGAWKTGCIQISDRGKVYKDIIGKTYSYNNRWNLKTPVGYKHWIELTKMQSEIVKEIPIELPTSEPTLITRMKQRKGFGFIWSIFVLHCYAPKIYPLYDQHVYRAFE